MEVEYLVAVGLFVVIFSFVVLFVSGNIIDQKEEISKNTVMIEGELIMKKLSSETDLQLISPMYRLYIYAENKNTTVDELVQIDLNDYGGGDVNSAYAVDELNNTYATVSYSSVVAFSSEIPSGTTKRFVFYFDDDSNFSRANNIVNGNDTFQERVYGPEKIWVVQNKLISRFNNRNYTDDDHFQIVIEDLNATKILEYGILPQKKTVIINKKPVMIQLQNAHIVPGWIRVSSW